MLPGLTPAPQAGVSRGGGQDDEQVQPILGLIALAPERKSDLIGLGLKSLFAGSIATCMTGAVVALLI
jgi:hypothetical protein